MAVSAADYYTVGIKTDGTIIFNTAYNFDLWSMNWDEVREWQLNVPLDVPSTGAGSDVNHYVAMLLVMTVFWVIVKIWG